MTVLAELVDRLAGRTDVRAVVVASPDGLPISSAGQPLDNEALAALTVTLARTAARLGDTAGAGPAVRMVIEGEGGTAILGQVRSQHWLLVLASPEADIGQLLFDLRQEGPALAAQL
jgi:predicted regulator of Ras-like GTPase activity (Roadblock/LC7/MglB family)